MSIPESRCPCPSKYVLEHNLSPCSHDPQLQQRIFEVSMNSSGVQVTRRRALAGVAAGIALSISRLPALAQQPAAPAQQPDTSQKPSTSPNQSRTSLHQEIALNAPPDRVFHI